MIKKNNSTINDVARVANVSKKTVSRVINKSPLLSEKTRAHVEQIIKDMGFVPNPQARALALRRNFIIAVIHDNPNAQFLVNVQKGILNAIKGSDFGLMVQPIDRNSPDLMGMISDFLERQRPYGVLLLPPLSENNEIAKLCESSGIRYVRMASVELDDPKNMVISNDKSAVYEAVNFLIASGHKKIALVEGPAGFASTVERKTGYTDAMAHAGLSIEPWMIQPGSYTFESGVAAGMKLLEGKERPTAVFASNDEMATGVLIAARKKGLDLPKDLSIIGFDDTPLSEHVWPALTTVHWPIEEMAHNAAKKLTATPEDIPVKDVVLKSKLIKRDSVADLL